MTDAESLIELETLGCCPLCDGPERYVLHERLDDPSSPSIGSQRWTLWTCRTCGAAYLDPRPTRDAIIQAYRADYYTHSPVSETARLGSVARARTRARHGYLNRRLGYDLQPASRLAGCLLGLFRRRAEVSSSSVRHLRLVRQGCLLDVGAGAGEFVTTMNRAGWLAKGIDPDPAAVEAARGAGADVTCATVESFAMTVQEATFDAITLNHVLEHVHDPLATLRACRGLLKPGGVIWVATPNLDSRTHNLFGPHWVHLDPPRHLVLFTSAALASALQDAGFATPTRLRTGSVASSAYAASNHIATMRNPGFAPAINRSLFPSDSGSLLARSCLRSAEEIAFAATRVAGSSGSAMSQGAVEHRSWPHPRLNPMERHQVVPHQDPGGPSQPEGSRTGNLESIAGPSHTGETPP